MCLLGCDCHWAWWGVAAFGAYQLLFWLKGLVTKTIDFKDKHVFISGGSKGLGKAIAAELVQAGAKVTIAARNQRVLDETAAWLQGLNPAAPKVQALSLDVTDAAAVKRVVNASTEMHGPVDVAIPCAGSAQLGFFTDISPETCRSSMNLNYWGVHNVVHAVVPSMKERKSGCLVIVSSGMAGVGYVGNSAYAPTKWALRGFGEVLRHELLPYGIKVHQAFPANFQSPGFENEEKMKPPVQKAIEEGETTYPPETIAKSMLHSIQKGEYMIACGDLGVNLLMRLSAGMSPRNNLLADLVIAPIGVLVGRFYNYTWDSIVCDPKWQEKKSQ